MSPVLNVASRCIKYQVNFAVTVGIIRMSFLTLGRARIRCFPVRKSPHRSALCRIPAPTSPARPSGASGPPGWLDRWLDELAKIGTDTAEKGPFFFQNTVSHTGSDESGASMRSKRLIGELVRKSELPNPEFRKVGSSLCPAPPRRVDAASPLRCQGVK